MRNRRVRADAAKRATLLLTALVLVPACGQDDRAPREVVELRGDTLVRRPILGAPTHALVEDLRIGSIADGSPAEFGLLYELTSTPFGGVVVYDGFMRRIDHFGADGQLLGRIGRPGQGPGEHNAVVGLGVRDDGNVIVQSYDGRILEFGPSGNLVHDLRTPHTLAPTTPVAMGDSLVALRLRRPEWAVSYVLMDRSWEMIDSIPVPTPERPDPEFPLPPVHGYSMVLWNPGGAWVTAEAPTGTLLLRGDSSLVRIEATRRDVAWIREEEAAWAEYLRHLWERRGRRGDLPEIPPHKPRFRSVVAARTGEIWVERSTESQGWDPNAPQELFGLQATPRFLAPALFDVFGPDGRYQSTVRGPSGIEIRAVSGDAVWAFRFGELGEHVVVRYRVVPEGAGQATPR